MKYTRQKVRDLNDIGPKKSVGIKLPMPPLEFMCDHKGKFKESSDGYTATCSVCGYTIDLW